MYSASITIKYLKENYSVESSSLYHKRSLENVENTIATSPFNYFILAAQVDRMYLSFFIGYYALYIRVQTHTNIISFLFNNFFIRTVVYSFDEYRQLAILWSSYLYFVNSKKSEIMKLSIDETYEIFE